MRLTLLVLLVLTQAAAAQPRRHRSQANHTITDSLSYYYNQMYQMRRSWDDSLRNSSAWKATQQHIERLRRQQRSTGYTSTGLFMGLVHTDYGNFNADNAQSGFSTMPPVLSRLGFSIGFKDGRSMFEFMYGIAGLGVSTSKNDERIRANLHSLFHLEWGYCIVSRKRVNLWPYAGVSLRFSSIRYRAPSYATGNTGNISTMLQGDRSITLQSNKPGYVAGLGLEFQVAGDARSGAMVFFKSGINNAFGREKYQHAGITYRPGIRQGDWMAAVGVKFFGR